MDWAAVVRRLWDLGGRPARRPVTRLRVERLESRDVPASPITPAQLFLAEGQHFEGAVARFSIEIGEQHPNPDEAIIFWGDGTTSAGTIRITEGDEPTCEILGEHTYARDGIYTASGGH